MTIKAQITPRWSTGPDADLPRLGLLTSTPTAQLPQPAPRPADPPPPSAA